MGRFSRAERSAIRTAWTTARDSPVVMTVGFSPVKAHFRE
jgi:hypothetical protein